MCIRDSTNRPSKQTDRISLLEQQVRGLGGIPVGRDHEPWEVQLQHARESCLSALRIWNDPVAMFRTGGFSLLLVTAWNSLAIAVIQQGHGEWRKLNADGTIQVGRNGEEQSRETSDLVGQAFAGTERHGLRENCLLYTSPPSPRTCCSSSEIRSVCFEGRLVVTPSARRTKRSKWRPWDVASPHVRISSWLLEMPLPSSHSRINCWASSTSSSAGTSVMVIDSRQSD